MYSIVSELICKQNDTKTKYTNCILILTTGEDVTLVPPDDIWWIWHVHMLSTRQYQTDCLLVTGSNLTYVNLYCNCNIPLE